MPSRVSEVEGIRGAGTPLTARVIVVAAHDLTGERPVLTEPDVSVDSDDAIPCAREFRRGRDHTHTRLCAEVALYAKYAVYGAPPRQKVSRANALSRGTIIRRQCAHRPSPYAPGYS